MKSAKNTAILILTLTFLAAGCSDTPFSPGNGKQPLGGVTTFGLVEVTISGIGTDAMTATARPARSNTAFALTRPSGTGGPNDGTIQMEPVSNGSFTFGTRGSGGVRYLYATFKVRNADVDGFIYPTPRQNLTFLAVDTDGTASAPETYGVTVISELRLFDGTELSGSPAAAIAEAAIPTGQVAQNGSSDLISTSPDVLRVFTEADVSALTTPTGAAAFPYGFMTRSPRVTPGSREVTTSPPGQFNGEVTFAFKLPLQSQANQDPFEISAIFLPVDDSETRITQALEEQTTRGNASLLARFAELAPAEVTIFPGSFYGGESSLQCDPVRVAGPAGSPTAVLFPPLPGFTSLTPDPYAADGSAGHIPATSGFTVSFAGPVTAKEPVGRRFVIHGHQSGLPFLSGGFSGNGTASITSPAGSFFPGEIVEVSRIHGFGACEGTVARYRTEVTAGSGTFSGTTIPVGDEPEGIMAGDWDGDGDLDLAVTNQDDDTISLLMGDGAGGFSVTTVPVGDGPEGITAGDWDGDGDLDLAVTNLIDNNVSLLEGDGAGGFSETTVSVGTFPGRITAGDWDGDGDPDLAVTNQGDDTISLLENNGAGVFSGTTIPVGEGPHGITAGNWDADGDLDLAVTNYNGGDVSLLEGDGAGGFTETTVSVGNNPGGVTAGDWDGDGDLDLAVTNNGGNYVSLLENNGAGVFSGTTISVGEGPQGITAGDWDGDGDLDLAVTDPFTINNNDKNVILLTNDGAGGFTETTVSVGDFPRGITAGDWDGDGDLDLAVTNNTSNNVSLLENQ